MSRESSIENTLIDLQTRLAYQEDLLQSLNTMCYQQDQKLQVLQRQNSELIEHFRSQAQTQDDAPDIEPPPPHY